MLVYMNLSHYSVFDFRNPIFSKNRISCTEDSQKPDRFWKPVRFEAGNYLSEKL